MMALAFGESQAIDVDAAFIWHKNQGPAQAGPFIMAVEAALLLGGDRFQPGGADDLASSCPVLTRPCRDCTMICTMLRLAGDVMKTLTYSAIRNNLAKAIEEVTEDHAPILITRQKGTPAVLISLEDFESWQETAYLARSPAMAHRLRRAVSQIGRGKAKVRKLIR